MNRTTHTLSVPTLLLAAVLATAVPAAADGPWQLTVSGASVQSTIGGGPNSSLGYGLAIGYRATPRIGVELEGFYNDFDSETGIDAFGTEMITETDFRMVPLLARLDVHLTPGRRAELYLGPVAGYVAMSDLTMRIRFPDLFAPVFEQRFRTADQYTWGAHVGVDVRLGASGRSFLTAGATYLDLPVELIQDFTVIEADDESFLEDPEFTIRNDFDPLIFRVGFSYRF